MYPVSCGLGGQCDTFDFCLPFPFTPLLGFVYHLAYKPIVIHFETGGSS